MFNQRPGCLGQFLKLFGVIPDRFHDTRLPYKKRDDFLSPSELSFYKVLQQYVGDKALICPKVSLQDIFFVNVANNSDRTAYYNKISRKHVDFLLCSVETLKPICGIELDDRSHQRSDRLERDRFVDRVFHSAGLKLIRFKNQSAYQIAEIEEKLKGIFVTEEFEEAEVTSENQEYDSGDQATPVCNKCKVPMVKRQAKRGENQGKVFYGCPNFPRCREIVEV
ncbi:MAG: DUF2726 domain-containing protein [Bacillaceae bacterium]|nr:DUF2726 domain-containing protein [Bacillaceae bacterium]